MPLGWRHESADLRDFEVLDASDTLAGPPGDDPLDRGVIPPLRWSSGMRFGTTAGEQAAGESHDRLLSEEEPDAAAVDDIAWDENATDDDIDRFSLHQSPDPRTGRLVADEGTFFPASTTMQRLFRGLTAVSRARGPTTTDGDTTHDGDLLRGSGQAGPCRKRH
jgi:hypothetical protein